MTIGRHLALVGLASLACGGEATEEFPAWNLVEERRIGSSGEGPDGFADVRGLHVDRGGNIWVIEFSTKDLRVFAPDGRHVRTVSREGKGPGELSYPDGLAGDRDGLVWVHDPLNQRFSLFDEDGRYVRQVSFLSGGYGYLWFGGIDASGEIWNPLIGHDPSGAPGPRYQRIRSDGTVRDTVRVPPCGSAEPDPSTFFQATGSFMRVPFAAGPVSGMHFGGESWCAPSSLEYRIVARRVPGGDSVAAIVGRTEEVPVTAAERAEAEEEVRGFFTRIGAPTPDLGRIPGRKPQLMGIQVDESERVWVRRATPGGVTTWDLYERTGRPIATVTAPFDPSVYHPAIVRGDRYYGIVRNEDEVPQVVIARVERPR